MFKIFTDQETMCEDRIDGGSDVLVLGEQLSAIKQPLQCE